MKITIRDAQENDLKNIAQIYVYSWKKAFSKFLLPSTINKLNFEEKEIYLKSILDNNGNIFIAENIKNKEIGGYIIYEKIHNKSIEMIANGIVYFIPADINSGKELTTVCHIYFHLLFLCNILKIKMLLVLSPTNSIHRFKYLITYIRLNIPSLA